MASQSSKIHLRTITIIGAGAAVLAFTIGYLLLKSESKKKSKKKVHNNNNNKQQIEAKLIIENNNEESGVIISEECIISRSRSNSEEINKLCDLYSLSSENKKQIDQQLINTDEYSDLERNNSNNNQMDCLTLTQHQHHIEIEVEEIEVEEEEEEEELLVNDKLSETSSDSGNGTSELNIVHSPIGGGGGGGGDEFDSRNIRSNTSPDSNNSIIEDKNNQANSSASNDSVNTSVCENEIKSAPQTPKIPQSASSMSISSPSTPHPETDVIVYEFHFPRKYCGKLIGRNGVHVDYIRNKTHVQIAVRNDPTVDDLQIVCLTGCITDVDQSLDIISARFPHRHYPQITFKPITKPIVYRRNRIENNKVLVSSNMYVPLASIKQSQTDVNVSAIVTPVHLFIQLPSQATYQLLQRLDEDMLHLYSTSDKNIPALTCPIEYGTICAAPTSYGWHRAMVTEYFVQKEQSQQDYPYYNGEIEMATIKFLDYGGYLNLPVSQLKQLR